MLPPIPELAHYGLDAKSGFIPSEPPIERLEDPYYAPWERLMDKFHGLLLAGRLREAIRKVSHFALSSRMEINISYLSFQQYILRTFKKREEHM